MEPDQLAAHHSNEGRLDSLEKSAEKTNLRLGSVETSLTGLVGDVKQLLAAVNDVQARPQFDLFRTAQIVVSAISIFGASVAGITYIVNAVNAADKVTLRKDVDFLQLRVERGWGIGGVTVQAKSGTQ